MNGCVLHLDSLIQTSKCKCCRKLRGCTQFPVKVWIWDVTVFTDGNNVSDNSAGCTLWAVIIWPWCKGFPKAAAASGPCDLIHPASGLWVAMVQGGRGHGYWINAITWMLSSRCHHLIFVWRSLFLDFINSLRLLSTVAQINWDVLQKHTFLTFKQ